MSDNDALRAAIAVLKLGTEVTLHDVLLVAEAGLEPTGTWVPRALVEAVGAKYAVDDDLANGGADQVAWNHGVERTRQYASAFRAAGAIENADLFARLADELAAHLAEHGEPEPDELVESFHAYRRRVGGPFFGLPRLAAELSEGLIELAIAHAPSFPDAPAAQ